MNDERPRPTIESWDVLIDDSLHVRVTFADGEEYERVFNPWDDEDRRALARARSELAYAARIDASDRVPAEDKRATRQVQHSLAVEALFPSLYHDSRLPA